MAVQQGYGKMAGANSLVFAYDTGDTRNSYKGEPTENMITGNMNTSGAASLGSDDQGDYIQLGNNTSGYAAIVVPNIYIPSGVTYTWSFELKASETFTSNFSWDTNEYSDQYPSSNDNSRVTYTHDTPTMVANEWVQYRLTVVMKDGLTNARSGDFFRFFFPTFQNKKIYYRNVQFELKDHITPYAGLGGGRSVTEGLLDLTGNNSIDLSNAGFNSSAEIDFDATSDYIAINNPTVPEGPYTILMIVKPGSPLTPGGSGAGKPNGNGRHTPLVGPGPVWNPGIWVTSDYIRSHAQTQYVDSAINWTTTTWQMIGMTFDGTNVKNIFGDQILPNAHTTGYNPPQPSELLIGAEKVGGSSYSWDGSVAVINIYNKVLTAAEVQANFNHYKTRFNLQ